jgi:hypothetical protein
MTRDVDHEDSSIGFFEISTRFHCVTSHVKRYTSRHVRITNFWDVIPRVLVDINLRTISKYLRCLHGVKSRKISAIKVTAVRTSDLTRYEKF